MRGGSVMAAVAAVPLGGAQVFMLRTLPTPLFLASVAVSQVWPSQGKSTVIIPPDLLEISATMVA